LTLDLETTLLVCGAIQIAVAATVIILGGSQKSYPGLLQWKLSFVLGAVALLIASGRFDGALLQVLASVLIVAATPLQVDGALRFAGVMSWQGRRGLNAVTGTVLGVLVLGRFWMPVDSGLESVIPPAALALEALLAVALLVRLPPTMSVPALQMLSGCFLVDALIHVFDAAMLIPHGYAPVPMQAGVAIANMVVLVFKAFGIVAAGTQRTEAELLMLSRDLERQASTDPLTKLRNRRSFYDLGDSSLAVAKRHDRPLTALMVDIDRFKEINDRHGHAGGDVVLVAVAEVMSRMLRNSDLIGRMGGEEFAILLVETGQRAAELTAERLRRGVMALHPMSPAFEGLTISIGLAPLAPEVTRLDELLQNADRALYRAKQEGRNRWVAVA